MRISDWSSDVCSSDLPLHARRARPRLAGGRAELPGPFPAAARTPRRAGDPRPVQRRPRARGDGAARPAEGDAGPGRGARAGALPTRHRPRRSEEHTTEIQSLMRISNAVFCLTNKTDLSTQNMTR